MSAQLASVPGFLFKGIIIGLSIAAPVGPIGILCIRRSVSEGPRLGLSTGLGAATADALYGAVAGFGLTTVSRFLVGERFWLQLIGGVFLCYLGLRAWREKSAKLEISSRGEGLAAAYASTFFLTLTNPVTILSFIAVFASLGLVNAPSYSIACALVGGVFLGSALWWIVLSQTAAWFRSRLSTGWMLGINRLSGGILIVFGMSGIALALTR